jgi:hypothetical protein
MADMLKTLYGEKKAGTEKNSGNTEDRKFGIPGRRGIFWSHISVASPGNNNRILPAKRRFNKKMPSFPSIRSEQILPGVICPECGEVFSTSDFPYTESTGLCIPCWERGALLCQ